MTDAMMSILGERVTAWHRARFPEATREHVVLKVCSEAGELADALLGKVGRVTASGSGDVPEEAADVAIALLALLGRWYPGVDLTVLVERKLSTLEDPASGHRSAALRRNEP